MAKEILKMRQQLMAQDEQRMTSLDIAAVTGKEHKNVLQAIRNMEPAWEKVHGLKFQPTQIRIEIPNGGYRLVPAFSLTKTESLYVATKFNDDARARLVLRWEQLERERLGISIPQQKLLVTLCPGWREEGAQISGMDTHWRRVY